MPLLWTNKFHCLQIDVCWIISYEKYYWLGTLKSKWLMWSSHASFQYGLPPEPVLCFAFPVYFQSLLLKVRWDAKWPRHNLIVRCLCHGNDDFIEVLKEQVFCAPPWHTKISSKLKKQALCAPPWGTKISSRCSKSRLYVLFLEVPTCKKGTVVTICGVRDLSVISSLVCYGDCLCLYEHVAKII